MSLFDSFLGKKPAAQVTETVSNTIENFGDSISGINPVENLSPKQKTQTVDYLDSFISYLLPVILLLTPLLFVPVLADSFDIPRQTFLLIGVLLGILAWSLKSVLSGKLSLTRSIFDLPVLIFVFVSLASSYMSGNRFASLTADTVIIAGTAGLFFLLSQHLKGEKDVTKATTVLLLSGALLSLWKLASTIYTLAAPSLKITTIPYYLSNSFSPTGSSLAEAILLAALLPLAVANVKRIKEKSSLMGAALLLIVAVGLVLNLYNLFQNHPILLDHGTSWKIATQTLGQSLTTTFVGVGPGNYVDSFTANKSVDFNNNPLWNLRFNTASNYYFYLLTTLGILGLAGFVFLAVRLGRTAKERFQLSDTSVTEKGLLASAVVLLVLMAFLPAPLVSLFALFTVLGLLASHYRTKGLSLYAKLNERDYLQQSWIHYVTGLGVLALLIASGYFLGRVILADYYYAQSLDAATKNRGTETYNLQIKALTFNPSSINYHVSYSQTNLALANALAGSQNLTDQQKQTVISLVQQSIREARLAATLDQNRASSWENLSLVYRNLFNFAQGADQWAIASQNQAIVLDPTNPRLRLDLGAILFTLKDFQSAAQVFNQAANLKPNYANAHYNLAQALRQLNLNSQALTELQQTATLVCAASATGPDCKGVNNEIDALNKLLGTKAASPAAAITGPAEQQSLATPGGEKSNLPKAKTQPPAKIASPSGQITP